MNPYSRFQCDECGQILLIELVSLMNTSRVCKCPLENCSGKLVLNKSSFDQLDFISKKYRAVPQLVQLLYASWARSPELKREYRRFVDCIRRELHV